MLYLALACLALVGLLAMATPGAGAPDDKDKPSVVLETSMGNITLELDREKAPITVDNFLKHVDAGYYKDTIFHRVIPDFMIQGGGFSKEGMKEKETRAPVKNESRTSGLSNTRGTIAMARTADPDSAKAQFFINLKDNSFLDRENSRDGFGYAVFGKVVDGMDVVDKIAKVETVQNRVSEGYPVKPIIIKSAKRKTQS